MTQYDSSRTRVAPVFDRLRAVDPTAQSWLPLLLALPERFDGRPTPSEPSTTQHLTESMWWPMEAKLPAPRTLLKHLVNDPGTLRQRTLASGRQPAERVRCLSGDVTAREEALRRIAAGRVTRGWHVFEGPSQPDVYLATRDLVVVIEGKRTENGPTTETTWMPIRHQMLRHLDAAYEIKGTRQLLGFFIVEGGQTHLDVTVPNVWRRASADTVSPTALEGSLPHRTPDEREAIAAAFAGVTTWQRVCAALDVPWEWLPKQVIA